MITFPGSSYVVVVLVAVCEGELLNAQLIFLIATTTPPHPHPPPARNLCIPHFVHHFVLLVLYYHL